MYLSYSDLIGVRVAAQFETHAIISVAGEEILGGQPVAVDGDEVVLAEHLTGSFDGFAITRTAEEGEICIYIPYGLIDIPNWEEVIGTPLLTPGANYFLNGSFLDTNPPLDGYSMLIGVAKSETILDCGLKQKVLLDF